MEIKQEERPPHQTGEPKNQPRSLLLEALLLKRQEEAKSKSSEKAIIPWGLCDHSPLQKDQIGVKEDLRHSQLELQNLALMNEKLESATQGCLKDVRELNDFDIKHLNEFNNGQPDLISLQPC